MRIVPVRMVGRLWVFLFGGARSSDTDVWRVANKVKKRQHLKAPALAANSDI